MEAFPFTAKLLGCGGFFQNPPYLGGRGASFQTWGTGEGSVTFMAQITEQIAGVSLPVMVLILAALTAARAALYATRAAFLRSIGDLLQPVLIAAALVFLVIRPFLVQSFFIPSGSMRPTLWVGDHIIVNKWAYRQAAIQRGDMIVFRAPKVAAPDEKEFIKRVIGLPGDVLQVREGFIVIGETSVWTRSEIRARLSDGTSKQQADNPSDLPPLRLTPDAIFLGEARFSPSEFAQKCGKVGKTVEIHPGAVLRNGQVLTEPYTREDPQYQMARRTVPPHALFVMGDNRNNSDDSHRWGMLPETRVIGRVDGVIWPVSHARRLEQ